MKDSRKAILTFHYPSNMNFGGSLQAFAVNKLFKDSFLIDYNPIAESLKYKLSCKIKGRGFIDFNNKFLKITEKYKSFQDLKKLNEKFDVFIVGSDQVWRPTWLKENIYRYYFDFVDEKNKKIAYAASFGTDSLDATPEVIEKLKTLAQRFDHVSVREESGIKICKENFNVDAVCVLDPTLMIDKRDYQPILDDWKDISHKNKKFIAHMLLDDTKELREQSDSIAQYLDAEINHIKGRDIKVLGKNLTFFNKVSQWLTYVKDAELVITDSFHCAVFSLIFKKKFVVVANPHRGIARLETLLSKVGLEDRFFTDIKDVLKSGILDKDIDYKEVEKKLEVHREISKEFLRKALES